MDITGAQRFEELITEVRDANIDVRAARLHGAAREVADRAGMLETLGGNHIHATVAGAVLAAQAVNPKRP